jgi:hypothetical protein
MSSRQPAGGRCYPPAPAAVSNNQEVLRNFTKSLIAVLAGNAAYFLLLVPRLPASARHRAFDFDLGLLIDFWVCLVIYGLIELLLFLRRAAHSRP